MAWLLDLTNKSILDLMVTVAGEHIPVVISVNYCVDSLMFERPPIFLREELSCLQSSYVAVTTTLYGVKAKLNCCSKYK